MFFVANEISLEFDSYMTLCDHLSMPLNRVLDIVTCWTKRFKEHSPPSSFDSDKKVKSMGFLETFCSSGQFRWTCNKYCS